jgi:hypothetical protein
MNQVLINQVVVRFVDPAGRSDDDHTRGVIERVTRGGECLPSATVWRGVAAMRLSVSNWSTDAADVTRSIAAIDAAHREP